MTVLGIIIGVIINVILYFISPIVLRWMGAEGETAHKESGIDRVYEAADVSPSLLKRIVPICGSVM